MSLQFEWDPKKAEANLAKHRVSFEEAIIVSPILWRESLMMTSIQVTSDVNHHRALIAAESDLGKFHGDWRQSAHMIAEGDKVATRISGRGTHSGEVMGAAPTGG